MAWACFCFLRITKITIPIKINSNPIPVPTKTYIKESAKKSNFVDRQTDKFFIWHTKKVINNTKKKTTTYICAIK